MRYQKFGVSFCCLLFKAILKSKSHCLSSLIYNLKSPYPFPAFSFALKSKIRRSQTKETKVQDWKERLKIKPVPKNSKLARISYGHCL